ncbi:hypothetical protein H5T53_02435, partial [Candidatus Bipolaricaulota bacterium]|nr:hypothetical protein [Candidatus Bipolaricaulota bacterium]
GGAGDRYPGGYWPTACLGRGPGELPRRAFAPLVLFAEEGAVAIAPADHFLVSPLVRLPGGAARGLSGAVDRLPAGFTLSTWFVAGEDPIAALRNLGDRLLVQGGKARPAPLEHPLLSTLGYWNAYGSYYTELLHPMDGALLEALAASFCREGIPVRYFGLDLWYPYREIGRAQCFRPDPRKYPQGLAEIAARTGLPYVLHLSALAEDNAYGVDGAESDVYRTIAGEVKGEGGIAAWHDWLRTCQHLDPALRADPGAAGRWFSGMARAFREQGLPVLLCMQTMGMALASTQEPNVVAARSHTDYLFAQRPALVVAARVGHPEFLDAWTPVPVLRRQNLLMGAVLWTLGLAPFHDLFLTRPHPGFGGDHPVEDAILRALSCGPVGFGDQLGLADRDLLRRLVLADGTLAQPDRPPFPVIGTLGSDVEVFWTERDLGPARWAYVIAINTAEEELPFRLDPPLPGEFLIWDGSSSRAVGAMEGRLRPGGVAYFVLAPQREGIAPVGLTDLLVPMPRKAVTEADWNGGWRLRLSHTVGPVTIVAKAAISVDAEDGMKVAVDRRGDVWLARAAGEGWLSVRGR